MNCRAASELLPLHAGHDLSPAEGRDLELHLSNCPVCSEELARFREARSALVSVREEGVEASGIWTGLAPRLDAVDAARRLQRSWYRQPATLTRLAAALLVLAMLPFALPWLQGGGSQPVGLADAGAGNGVAPTNEGLALESEVVQGLIPVPREELREFLRGSNGLPLRAGANSGNAIEFVGVAPYEPVEEARRH